MTDFKQTLPGVLESAYTGGWELGPAITLEGKKKIMIVMELAAGYCVCGGGFTIAYSLLSKPLSMANVPTACMGTPW